MRELWSSGHWLWCGVDSTSPRCARSWWRTPVCVTGICGSLLIIVLLGCVLSTCLASPQYLDPVSFEGRELEEFVHSLLEDDRYAEAISYLKRDLETLPAGAPRLNRLLLLADCQLEITDLSGALATLTEAESLAAEPSAEKAVAKRKERLSELQALQPPPPPEVTFGSQELLSDTGEVEKPPEAWVSNSFFETDLRQVLTDIAMETGIPIIWDATVEGLVTYEAVDQPLETVLKAVLLPAGYAFRLQDGIYYVGSAGPDDPAFGLLSQTVVVTLSNIEATEAVSLLSDHFKPFLNASEKTNIVCVTAPPATLERILQDLEALDQPPLQILIEAVITEVSGVALRKMGLDWRLGHSSDNSFWEVGTDHTDIPEAALFGQYAELGLDIAGEAVDLAASLQLLLETGDANIRASPRIITLNGHTAEIGLTIDRYFILHTGAGGTFYQYNTLERITTGITLEITPYASTLGTITVHVTPEVDDVLGAGAQGLPEIIRRTASTSVRVRDGETFVIGGLNVQSERIKRRKVPLLGSIPLLGYLFRYDEREVIDTEIVIFITPHILGG